MPPAPDTKLADRLVFAKLHLLRAYVALRMPTERRRLITPEEIAAAAEHIAAALEALERVAMDASVFLDEQGDGATP